MVGGDTRSPHATKTGGDKADSGQEPDADEGAKPRDPRPSDTTDRLRSARTTPARREPRR